MESRIVQITRNVNWNTPLKITEIFTIRMLKLRNSNMKPFEPPILVLFFSQMFNYWYVCKLFYLEQHHTWEDSFGFAMGMAYLFITFYFTGSVAALMVRCWTLFFLIIVNVPLFLVLQLN